jgi:hypothetical protein
MLSAIFAFTYGLIIFALVGEADSEWLRITGIIAGSWMVLSGAVAGWQSSR